MLLCQFLCHVLIALFFIKIALKLSYFCKKCKIFERWGLSPQTPLPPAAGDGAQSPQPPAACGFVPRPPLASGGWGFRSQTPKTALPFRIFGYAPGCAFERRSPLESGEKVPQFWWRPFFFGIPLNSGKKCSIFGEELFFGLHLICSTEKNRSRGLSQPMLKIGKN